MNCTDAFPRRLKKRINKTGEARHGKGIYKRRNSRAYRVILHLSTYRKIEESNPEFLNNFERGYAVRVKPSEYFKEDGSLKTNFPNTLKLGKNAFIYFKTIKDWNIYGKYCVNSNGNKWDQVVELYTTNDNVPNDDQWIGKYCCFINNTKPKIISEICGSDNIASYLKTIKEKYGLKDIPEQTGLGNFDYDYANNEEVKKIKYQMTYLILNTTGMKDYLIEFIKVGENDYDLSSNIKTVRGQNKLSDFINKVAEHVEEFCTQNNLIDFEKLVLNRCWDKSKKTPICPLCLLPLLPKEFFETASQAEGREEEDNTQSEIVLMHIKGLKPGELNHRTYNLGWGHKHCNTIQGDLSIKEILEKLKKIINRNENFNL